MPRKAEDLAGNKYNGLTVIERVPNKGKSIMWLCKCECGNKTIVKGSHLKDGHTSSCGCKLIELMTTHGLRKNNKSEYGTWIAMKQRCNNKIKDSYANYGGRGIKVCERWENSFENFLSDMGKRPLNSTIDRIDNNKGYYPENCRWSTDLEQNRNMRKTKRSKTGVRGVYDVGNKYKVMISVENKNIFVGYYKSKKEAELARKNAEIEYWGKTYD